MPFCQQCGVEVGTDSGERYCWSCGADQADGSDGAPAVAVAAPNAAASVWEDATSRAATLWDDPTTRTLAVYVGAGVVLALVAWSGGIESVLLALPLLAGSVVALAKPQSVIRWLQNFESWTSARHSLALARQGRFSRWVVRPYLAGLQRVNGWTSHVKDESMRCGVRIASYLYFSLFFGLVVLVAAYAALAVVIAIVMIVVMFWVLSEWFGSDRPSYSWGRSASRERIGGSSIVRKGVLWDTTTGIGVNKKGEVVKEGIFFDDPAGVKVNERGQIVTTGIFGDTPTGLSVENGRVEKEGIFSNSPTGLKVERDRITLESNHHVSEDGDVVREGFFSDEPTGVQFKKDKSPS